MLKQETKERLKLLQKRNGHDPKDEFTLFNFDISELSFGEIKQLIGEIMKLLKGKID